MLGLDLQKTKTCFEIGKRTLYKYTSLKYLQDALEYGVYAAKLDQVNDPYEGHDIEYMDKYRVVCLTGSDKAMLLWAYYVQHRGCCIEYYTPDDYSRVIHKVGYTDSFFNRREMNGAEIIESLYHKGKEWEHENEFRAVYYETRDGKKDYWRRIGDRVFFQLKIKSITFGVLSHEDQMYFDSLRLINKLANDGNPGIEIKKLIKSNDRYQLILDKQYDIQHELEHAFLFAGRLAEGKRAVR